VLPYFDYLRGLLKTGISLVNFRSIGLRLRIVDKSHDGAQVTYGLGELFPKSVDADLRWKFPAGVELAH